MFTVLHAKHHDFCALLYAQFMVLFKSYDSIFSIRGSQPFQSTCHGFNILNKINEILIEYICLKRYVKNYWYPEILDVHCVLKSRIVYSMRKKEILILKN